MMSGDEEALALLYSRRQAGIYRFALQMSGSQAVAEDVTQEVFLFLIKTLFFSGSLATMFFAVYGANSS